MAHYPPARIPVRPILSWCSFGVSRAAPGSVLDVKNLTTPLSARAALAQALSLAGIGAGDDVLMPAYHCISIVKPVIAAAARPVFYRVRADLSVDLDDVATKAGPRTRALLVIHYFGFPQDMRRLRAFCDANRLTLIEDCAHAFFGRFDDQPPGAWGDYAVASPAKFFAVADGGYLVSSTHRVAGASLASVGVSYEIKALTLALEWAVQYRRFRPLTSLLAAALRVKELLWKSLKRTLDAKVASAPGMQGSERSDEYDPASARQRASLWSRIAVRASNRARIATLRRARYRRLLQALSGLPGCTPLKPELPEGVVPYVFPLLVENAVPLFDALKRQGVPIVRFGEFLFDGVDATVCKYAHDYSQRLLQFPVHQEMTEPELNWMIATIRETALALATPAMQKQEAHG